MKKIKLTEDELTKIISKVIKEQDEKCPGIRIFEKSYGYKQGMGRSLQKAITPDITFYITPEPTTASRHCNYTLFWQDGMDPIDLGQPDFCFKIAKAYEDAFKMKRAK